MSARVLILGAGGRLGYAAARAFRDAGWTVISLVRPGRAAHALRGTQIREVDALDHAAVSEAARAGDFYGGGRGSWFDLVIAKEIGRGRLVYPGPLDLPHEWAYLPDVVAAMLRLVEIREALPAFATFGFPGHAVTGREFTTAIAR